ncbi:RCC1/BLIP-II [Lentinula raphanica]|uniref:RCC1/BLIP-II n=1 Tax=Lentinula raphanica TaxID=153919 RepID=A0AA38PIY2_9AGAR|nr:RCC1/BLIP-II [Lentinula raphanica]KAJ3843783.1 RCC1/BLIP-II [Lentinula raphanica]
MFSLLSSGSNAHGQLALGTKEDAHTFSRCIFYDGGSNTTNLSEDIIHVASGGNHTLLLSERTSGENGLTKRTLWGCGNGAFGQLGECMKDEDQLVFRRMDLKLAESGLECYQPRLICCSWETSYVVLSGEGKSDVILSMGGNDFGDLGVGQSAPPKSFHVVSFNHLRITGLALDQVHLRVISISAGQHHVIAQLHVQLSNQSHRVLIVGWGAARHGQLGDAPNLKKNPVFISLPKIVEVPLHPNDSIVRIALGHQHSVFLHDSGSLIGLGSNKKSQLAGLDGLRNVSSVGCTWNGTYILDALGILYATGDNSRGQLGHSSQLPSVLPSPVEVSFATASRISNIACGSEHVLITRTESPGVTPEVWGWGWNEHGNLGLGSTLDIRVPSKLWPRDVEDVDSSAVVTGIWAGCGTSWLALRSMNHE